MAVVTGPNCASACEFFTSTTWRAKAAPTSSATIRRPAWAAVRISSRCPISEMLQISIGRPVDMDGNIIVEGTGVAPTVRVPVTEETLFAEGDPLLDTAIAAVIGDDLPYGAVREEAAAEAAPAESPAAKRRRRPKRRRRSKPPRRPQRKHRCRRDAGGQTTRRPQWKHR